MTTGLDGCPAAPPGKTVDTCAYLVMCCNCLDAFWGLPVRGEEVVKYVGGRCSNTLDEARSRAEKAALKSDDDSGSQSPN